MISSKDSFDKIAQLENIRQGNFIVPKDKVAVVYSENLNGTMNIQCIHYFDTSKQSKDCNSIMSPNVLCFSESCGCPLLDSNNI